jgi:hypothetical protein
MAKVVMLRPKKRKPMTMDEYNELITTLEDCIEELRPIRAEAGKSTEGLDEALGHLKTARWDGYNPKAREEYRDDLMQLLEEVYEEINT